jgi:putative ABC transport system substrate-binding protein
MNKKLLWLLTLLSLAAVTFAEAQRAGKVYRIGVLEVISTARNAANFDAFRQGLRELGYGPICDVFDLRAWRIAPPSA